jgi:mannose-1-phosphate guanylyltransferase
MRHAVILAGGSGQRLWPLSLPDRPKQLLPLINGRSLLEIAYERLEGLFPAEGLCICAADKHADEVLRLLPRMTAERYLGEPYPRDTLGAIGLSAAVLAQRDPDATVGIFTADHVIEPVKWFQDVITQGYELAERRPEAIVLFGVVPTSAATVYGYLEVGEMVAGQSRRVRRFHEKPAAAVAEMYLSAGPERYLWNSGMLVSRADTLLEHLGRFAPQELDALERIATDWDTPRRGATLERFYPTLRKISFDFAVLEPASTDPAETLTALPMPLRWLDVGSWPALAKTCPRDDHGNALAAKRAELMDTRHTLVFSSDPQRMIATIGCEEMIIVHGPNATLVCPASRASDVKQLYERIVEHGGVG